MNDPLNLGVWWNGAVAIADAALKGVGAGAAGEINYVFARLAAVPAPRCPGWRRRLPPTPPTRRCGCPWRRRRVMTSTPSTESSPAPEAPSATPDPTEPVPADPQTEDP